MKKYIAYLGLFTVLSPFNLVWAGKSLPELEQGVESLKATIPQKFNTLKGVVLVAELKNLAQQFDSLEADNEVWHSFISSYNEKVKATKMQDKASKEKEIEIWLDQTPKQAVGSHLFYPKGIEELRDSSYTEPLLRRNATLWSFAIAARYQDPRGFYYISRILGSLWNDYNDPYGNKEKFYPKFFEDLAKRAVNGLKHTADKDAQKANPEALMILAQEYVSIRGHAVCIASIDLPLSIEYFEKIANSPKANLAEIGRSKTQLLNFRERYSETYTKKPRPTINEYIKVAEDYSYGRALVQGVSHVGRENTKEGNVKYLEEAASKYGYFHSYIGLGTSISSEDDDKAEEYFKLAGDKGITRGYIKAGLLYLGKDILGKSDDKLIDCLSELDDDQINIAKEWFQKAINNNDFQGWDYMASLSYGLSLLEKENPNNQHKQDFRKALEEGMNLGSPYAYSWLNDAFSPQEIKELIQKYGAAPQGDLWKDIKAFIEAKIPSTDATDSRNPTLHIDKQHNH